MTITPSTQLRDVLDYTKSFGFSTLWQIVRTDLTQINLTDYNRPLVFFTQTYDPALGVISSSRTRNTDTTGGYAELSGPMDGTTFDEDDFRAGRFRDAAVTEYLVDNRYAFAGQFYFQTYYVDEASWDSERWVLHLSGLRRYLRTQIGDTVTKTCRNTLGDDNCGVNVDSASFKEACEVTAVTNRNTFRVDCTINQGDDFFKNGTIEFTSGDNDELTFDIASSTAVGGPPTHHDVTLFLNTPFDVAVTDDVIIRAGCDWTVDTCVSVFNNIVNFNGEPNVPGAAKASGSTFADDDATD